MSMAARSIRRRAGVTRGLVAVSFSAAVLAAGASCRAVTPEPQQRTFRTPEDAVGALTEAARAGNLDEILEIFGPDGRELVDSSDPATARANREVFVVAAAERADLVDLSTGGKTLVVGHEEWPFPVPLTRDANGWRFDTAAGKEELIARRIGRNELAAIRVARTYVAAQRLYAKQAHDGKPAGLFARSFRSDPGRQNGLYWPASRGQKRSPLGDLAANAATDERDAGSDRSPSPFHGYYFRILTGQGPAAPGGAKDYLVDGEMSGGFALVAWPAHYDVTGVMTFVVNHDGHLSEKDLGPETDAAARAMTLYDPDASWTPVGD